MRLKPGVNITGVRPEMLIGLMAAQKVYDDLGYDLVVTSCLDGKHSPKSLHYAGCAVDLRTRHMGAGDDSKRARDRIAEALPNDFDVVLESNHIHLEFQPRRRP